MKRLLTILIATLVITSAMTAQNKGRSKFATDMYQAKHEMIIEECPCTSRWREKFIR